MIRIESFTTHPTRRIGRADVRRTAAAVFRHEGRPDVRLNVVFTDDATIKKLNGEFLGHRYVTDVLSFPLGEEPGAPLEGEIYINLDQAARQAAGENVTLRNETHRLLIHGVLHLVGYDDRTPRQRGRMTRKEDEYLKMLRIP